MHALARWWGQAAPTWAGGLYSSAGKRGREADDGDVVEVRLD